MPEKMPERNSPTEFQNTNSQNESRAQNIPTAALTITAPESVSLSATDVLTKINLGAATVQNAFGVFSVSNNAPFAGFPVGQSQVVWTVVDEAGRNATAIQIVQVDASLACNTKKLFFNQRVWPLLSTYCIECHANNIVESPLNFVDEQAPNYLNLNYEIMRQSALLQDRSFQNPAGLSLLLSKSQNLNDNHVGGEIFAAVSTEYDLLKSMVERFSMCNQVESISSGIVKISPLQQLRKITLSLAGRLPNQHEADQLNALPSLQPPSQPIAQPDPQLELIMDGILNSLLTEDAFYQRLKEIYNDVLLTDAYSQGAKALSLDLTGFDNKNYFGNLELMQQGYNGTDSNKIRNAANYGVSQAPLALIEYVVRNNLPFTEILQADYVLVNPYSATLFNAVIPGKPTFNFVYGDNIDEHDENLFLPVRLTDSLARNISHAGLLTTLPYLSRYPSTNTNLNRKRARYVFKYFLDVDIEGIASRSGLNLDNIIGDIPTLEDPQCKVCHDILDPVAGLFKNWGNKGVFLGDNLNWFNTSQPPEILSPGYGGFELPVGQSATSLQWLALKIAQDDRFVSATVKTVFRGITGIKSNIDPMFTQAMKQNFVDSGFNLKVLIKMIVRDDHFLAENALQFISPADDSEHGTAHLLTPEQLYRKIDSIFNGAQWRSPSKRNLLSFDSYRLLYGGIDSIEVNERTSEATSLIAGVQMRIANQLSCQLVPQDFNLPNMQRNLFPYVEITHVPETAVDALEIRKNIQFLYGKILGQQIDVNHVEIDRIFNLFVSVKNQLGVESVARECRGDLAGTSQIIVDANKTVRSWIAVVNYMLRDYAFLYE